MQIYVVFFPLGIYFGLMFAMTNLFQQLNSNIFSVLCLENWKQKVIQIRSKREENWRVPNKKKKVSQKKTTIAFGLWWCKIRDRDRKLRKTGRETSVAFVQVLYAEPHRSTHMCNEFAFKNETKQKKYSCWFMWAIECVCTISIFWFSRFSFFFCLSATTNYEYVKIYVWKTWTVKTWYIKGFYRVHCSCSLFHIQKHTHTHQNTMSYTTA